MGELKVVLGYIAWSEYARDWHEGLVRRARGYGYDVEAFCLTPRGCAPRYAFPELDRRWQQRDPDLLEMHARLKTALAGADVFWNFNGANVHPAWLSGFATLNVYGCFDDPESSRDLSHPVARYADACLVGNLACGPLYESWGVRHHAWAPLAFVGGDYDPRLTPEQVEREDRPLPVVFFGEKQGRYRRDRLDRLAQTFPEAVMCGHGWPGGYVSVEQRRQAYRQARIGWNVHNGVGPVNLRFFALMANGVMQLCDNKCRAGQVFRLDEELVGFDTIEECVELTRYYLAHDDERRRIAANGLRRYQSEFTEEKIWERYYGHFRRWTELRDELKAQTPVYLPPKQRSYSFVLRERLSIAGRRVLNRFGLEWRCEQEQPEAVASITNVPYEENPEAGGINLLEKEKRRAAGGHFEWPNMVALNWVCARLVGSAKEILDIGGGTGCFAWEASAVPQRRITCVDADEDAISWAKQHRSRANIQYVAGSLPQGAGSFDLVVAIDVIEHVHDFPGFLRDCCRLAPRAILTTPNKWRDALSDTAGPPAYYQHVREWTAGEFYWVLRTFYRDVALYAMPDVYVPEYQEINVQSTMTPLIAVCSDPVAGGRVNA